MFSPIELAEQAEKYNNYGGYFEYKRGQTCDGCGNWFFMSIGIRPQHMINDDETITLKVECPLCVYNHSAELIL